MSDWTIAELVRALQAQAEATKSGFDETRETLKAIQQGVADQARTFTLREVSDERHRQIVERLDEHGKEIADVQADLARHHREHADAVEERAEFSSRRWDSYVGPILSGVIVGALLLLLGHVLT